MIIFDGNALLVNKIKGGMRMKTRTITIVILTTLLLASIATSLTLAYWKNQQLRGDYISDHALFDTTSGDLGARCKVLNRIFEFYMVVRAFSGPATIKITFHDGSWLEFPLKEADATISFTQAAGGTIGVDDELTVTVTEGDAVGWISIRAQKGARADTKSPYFGSFCVTIPKE